MTTVFQKIIRRELPADVVYEDDLCLAFKDINPQASTHVLLIPKKAIVNLADAEDDDRELLGHLLLTIPKVAEELGIGDGFKVLSNNGASAGQEVFHLHFHILSGDYAK